jgi:hypothetical protein
MSTTSGDLAIDDQLADMKTAHVKVLHCQRAYVSTLQAQRADDHASNRHRPDGRGTEGQSADRQRADGCGAQGSVRRARSRREVDGCVRSLINVLIRQLNVHDLDPAAPGWQPQAEV